MSLNAFSTPLQVKVNSDSGSQSCDDIDRSCQMRLIVAIGLHGFGGTEGAHAPPHQWGGYNTYRGPVQSGGGLTVLGDEGATKHKRVFSPFTQGIFCTLQTELHMYHGLHLHLPPSVLSLHPITELHSVRASQLTNSSLTSGWIQCCYTDFGHRAEGPGAASREQGGNVYPNLSEAAGTNLTEMF